jgi:hypothetical protein
MIRMRIRLHGRRWRGGAVNATGDDKHSEQTDYAYNPRHDESPETGIGTAST